MLEKIEKENDKDKKQKHKGFSLIELIVVAGIIALLATLVIISVSKARLAVRDAKRTDSVRTMVLALEQYYSKFNAYPSEMVPGTPLVDSDGIVYMATVPTNPTPRNDGDCPDADFNYESFNNGAEYMLTFCLAGKTGSLNPGVNYYQNSSVLSCGYPITDRDGYTYNTVNIGGQCWMAENLKTKTKPDGSCVNSSGNFVAPQCTSLDHGIEYGGEDDSERDCMSSAGDERGVEADCDAGRVLYTIDAAMNGSTDEGDQGLCPNGWHIPSDSEWHTLEAYLSDSGSGPSCDPNRTNEACSGAGTKMLTGGNSGLNLDWVGLRLLGGYPNGFIGWNSVANFWSSTIFGHHEAYGRTIPDYNHLLVGRWYWDSTNSFPVRCIINQ
jgi:uncharacterized protein (TIGR02145 family)/prepilin-type N-terminal cleavage/methylation domain-containing protein